MKKISLLALLPALALVSCGGNGIKATEAMEIANGIYAHLATAEETAYHGVSETNTSSPSGASTIKGETDVDLPNYYIYEKATSGNNVVENWVYVDDTDFYVVSNSAGTKQYMVTEGATVEEAQAIFDAYIDYIETEGVTISLVGLTQTGLETAASILPTLVILESGEQQVPEGISFSYHLGSSGEDNLSISFSQSQSGLSLAVEVSIDNYWLTHMKINTVQGEQSMNSVADIQVRNITRHLPDLSEYTLVTGA